LDDIDPKVRARIERDLFKQPLDEVWEQTQEFWKNRDPRQLRRAEQDSRHKMALTFRWYLGHSSRWARAGTPDRKRDYQVWCGASMGAFNSWVKGSWLEEQDARKVVDIARAMIHSALLLRRLQLASYLAPELEWENMTRVPEYSELLKL